MGSVDQAFTEVSNPCPNTLQSMDNTKPGIQSMHASYAQTCSVNAWTETNSRKFTEEHSSVYA